MVREIERAGNKNRFVVNALAGRRRVDHDLRSVSHGVRSHLFPREFSSAIFRERSGENLWHSEVSPVISVSRGDSGDARIARRQPECHARTNPTDRTDAGVERRRHDVARAARFPGTKSAGTTPAIAHTGNFPVQPTRITKHPDGGNESKTENKEIL